MKARIKGGSVGGFLGNSAALPCCCLCSAVFKTEIMILVHCVGLQKYRQVYGVIGEIPFPADIGKSS
jgi:hypothetical protein